MANMTMINIRMFHQLYKALNWSQVSACMCARLCIIDQVIKITLNFERGRISFIIFIVFQ